MKYICAVVLFASSCYAVPVVVPPACVPASLNTYIGSAGTGCSQSTALAELQFSDFGFVRDGPLTPGHVRVTPTPTASVGGLKFTADFSAPTGETFTYLTFFTIDPPPIIHGFEDDLFTRTPKNGGKASVLTELCIGAAFTNPGVDNSCSGTLATLFVFFDSSAPVPSFQLTDRVKFTAAVDVIGVRNTITLDANVGTSNIAGFGNTAVVIPEAGTFGFVLAGVGLLVLRRRR